LGGGRGGCGEEGEDGGEGEGEDGRGLRRSCGHREEASVQAELV